MPPPSSTENKAAAQATAASAAAQQGDNIAHALAGAGGGLLSMTLTYPLITLSTRAQVESKRAHTSTLDAVRHIVRREGMGGLYSGLESALFGISVTNFVYYYWYEWTRAFFERAAIKAGRASRKLTTIESMIAGAIAGAATVLITNPIWVINTRMTARSSSEEEEVAEPGDREKGSPSPSPSPSSSPAAKKRKAPPKTTLGTLRKLLREEGPRALFSGVLPALVLVVNPILQYTIFEQLKNLLERRRRLRGSANARVGPRDAFYLGAVGKLLATTITYPYITVKSRAHVGKKSSSSTSTAGEQERHQKQDKDSMMQGLRSVVREEGWSGLYAGIGPKVTQSVLTAAFLFAFKDALYDMSVTARRKIAAKTV